MTPGGSPLKEKSQVFYFGQDFLEALAVLVKEIHSVRSKLYQTHFYDAPLSRVNGFLLTKTPHD